MKALHDGDLREFAPIEISASTAPSGSHQTTYRTPEGELTEDALALTFERGNSARLRYCHSAGSWYLWTGMVWEQDGTREVFNLVREMCRLMAVSKSFATAKAASAIERFSQAARSFAVKGDQWDRDPMLLGTPAGTVDLRTGQISPPKASDFITRMTSIGPAAKGKPPRRWLRFLHDATKGDKDLTRFLQQIAGYVLSGDTSAHAFFFVYGPGGNGKSVFLNTVTHILGDYSRTAPIDTFTASRHEPHPTGLAMLKGARLVTASETEEGRTWAEAKIKQMTGGDPITARFMNRDFFTFQPEFKLVIVGNHKPNLKNVDEATRRRINIIPFIHQPPNVDRRLEQDLRSEAPEILSWMIEGFLDWQLNGFVRPSVVEEATKEYFEEQDLIGQWLDDCCEEDAEAETANVLLFSSWKHFAEENGARAGDMKQLSAALRKRKFESFKTGSTRGFRGLRVHPAYSRDPDPEDSRHYN